jgi:type IV pilus assembly protein PilQ
MRMSLSFSRGASPRRTPLHARSRGPLHPAPLPWLTRCARSLASKECAAIRRLLAGALIAAIAGGLVVTAAPSPVRLLGVSAQATGRTAALLIEATEPVAYAVSRPDPLTLLVDLRNVSVADAENQVAHSGPVERVTLEQATAIDGKALARVRVALAAPSTYRVRSARNTIRVELEPSASAAFAEGTPAAVKSVAPEPTASSAKPGEPLAAATVIERVRASNTRSATTITISGNGRLDPSSLTEPDDQPRRLLLEFPNVTSKAPAQMSVDSSFVKKVHVAANGHDPLVTRVVMDLSPTATYHIERVGPGGNELAVVFEGRRSSGAILVAPPEGQSGTDAEPGISLQQALANGASLAAPDPITALNQDAPAAVNPAAAASKAALAPRQARQTAKPAPAPPPAQTKPSTPPQPAEPQPAAPAAPSAKPTLNAQMPGTGEKKYTGNPISMDFQDADLRSVLRTFAEISGLNMVIDPQVQGRVDMVLNEVPWDQALDTILRGNKLGWTVDGTIVRIVPLKVLEDETKERASLEQQQALAGELHVQTFALSYAKAGDLSPLLTKSALSQRGQIQVDSRTNTLIITDLPDRLQMASQLISTLDKAEPQVEVEARVVQTTRDFARAIGIQWGLNGRVSPEIGNTTPLAFPNNGSLSGRVGGTQGPNDPRSSGATNNNTATAVNLGAAAASSAIGLALGSINGAFNLDVALTALENTGKGRILSTPRLTTQNNQEAEVAQGIQIPIQVVANNTVTVSFKDAVLLLKVTPQITAANTVIMNITVENATPDFSRAVNGVPPIDTQRAITRVQVTDGATTVIGGIFVSQEQSTNDRTPVLHRIPLLGWLFRRDTLTDSSRELLIFITPRILRG